MADIPDNPVGGGVENIMQRDCQLDDAKAGAKMAARDRNGVDRFVAELVRNLPQIRGLQFPQILRRPDRVEKGSFRCGQNLYSFPGV
jgi:hypothetical protein